MCIFELNTTISPLSFAKNIVQVETTLQNDFLRELFLSVKWKVSSNFLNKTSMENKYKLEFLELFRLSFIEQTVVRKNIARAKGINIFHKSFESPQTKLKEKINKTINKTKYS